MDLEDCVGKVTWMETDSHGCWPDGGVGDYKLESRLDANVQPLPHRATVTMQGHLFELGLCLFEPEFHSIVDNLGWAALHDSS